MKKQIQQQKQEELKHMLFSFAVETAKFTFDENGAPNEIQVLMCGKWNHPVYGPMIIEPSDITEFKKNFDDKLRRDIPITEGHESFDEKPAVGWFKELIDKGQEGLWATMEWTPKGKTLLAEKAYKYFSPEFYTEYEDPETREIYTNVLVGGALTNKPYFKRMKAVVLSEQTINKDFKIFNDKAMFVLEEVVAKKVEDLSIDEKAFLVEKKGELTEEQLATFASVFEPEAPEAPEAPAETPAETPAPEVPAEAPVETPAETPAPETPAAPVEASEPKNLVQINASELKALQDKADEGQKALSELAQREVKDEVSKLVFSEQNSDGKFLPKDADKVEKFMAGLSKEQRAEFSEIVNSVPTKTAQLFQEIGSGSREITAGTAAEELNNRIVELQESDKSLKYSDALRQVLAADKNLAAKYSEEIGKSVK